MLLSMLLLFLSITSLGMAQSYKAGPMPLESCVHGQVINAETGEPISGVLVMSFTVPESSALYEYEWHGVGLTNEQGLYTLEATGELSYGVFDNNLTWDYNLVFGKKGYVLETKYLNSIKPFQPCSEFNVALEKAEKYEGRIVDAEGKPIEGVLIECMDIYVFDRLFASARPARPKVLPPSVLTDKNGKFIVYSPFLAILSKHGYASQKVDVELFTDKENIITLNPQSLPVTVTVLDHNDNPVSGVDVFVDDQNSSYMGIEEDGIASVVTDIDGKAIFNSLDAGVWDVWTWLIPKEVTYSLISNSEPPQLCSDCTTVTTSLALEASVTLQIPKPVKVTGKILNEAGDGVSGVILESGLFQNNDFALSNSTVSDSEGRYQFNAYPSGKNLIYIRYELPKGYSDIYGQMNDSQDNQYLWRVEPESDLSNYIIPVKRISSVTLKLPDNAERDEIIFLGLVSRVAPLEKNYRLANQRPFSKMAYLIYNNEVTIYVPVDTFIEVSYFGENQFIRDHFESGPAGTHNVLDIKPSEYGGIKGVVTLDGKPVSEATIRIQGIISEDYQTRSTPLHEDQVSSGPDGRFEHTRIAPGEQAIDFSFSGRNYFSESRLEKIITVRENKDIEVNFEYFTKQIIRGKLVDSENQPATAAQISGGYHDAEGKFQEIYRTFQPNKNGEFEIILLEPFEYEFDTLKVSSSWYQDTIIHGPFGEEALEIVLSPAPPDWAK